MISQVTRKLQSYYSARDEFLDYIIKSTTEIQEALDLYVETLEEFSGIHPLVWDIELDYENLDQYMISGSIRTQDCIMVKFEGCDGLINITLYSSWDSLSPQEIAQDIVERSKKIIELDKTKELNRLKQRIKFLEKV